jgi:primosomal protein N' (replication factor Y)
MAFLQSAREGWGEPRVDVLGPAPAGMQRRAGHFRAQLLLRGRSRAALHRGLLEWLPSVEALPAPRALRWSLDVDPTDLF